MVHCSLFMVLSLHFMLFCVSRHLPARGARARMFSCIFVGIKHDIKIFLLTPKIIYLGNFLSCMVHCSCNLVEGTTLKHYFEDSM